MRIACTIHHISTASLKRRATDVTSSTAVLTYTGGKCWKKRATRTKSTSKAVRNDWASEVADLRSKQNIHAIKKEEVTFGA